MPDTVIAEPKYDSPPAADLVITLATIADDIYAWGKYPAYRDKQLREFWPTENMLAGAIYSTVSRYASFNWLLTGPPHSKAIVQKVLQSSEFGAGLSQLFVKVLIDLFTQDNGAFIEVVRTSDNPTAPVVTLNHLDSGQCIRTGRRDEPVKYIDADGKIHRLKWYQVIPLAEFPSPIEKMRGMQVCAVSRILRAAQILRDVSIYEREKISGRFNRAVHLVGGIQRKTIEDAMTRQSEEANNIGTIRYLQPLIISGIDPTASVSHEIIELASLPDHFNKDELLKWYINQLALAFGTDYQDYAPLPAGNVGTSTQSETLDRKARGKGPRLFMTLIENAFNFRGIMPSTVKFSFGEQDYIEDINQAKLRLLRAQERQVRISSGEITTQVARQLAVDFGDLPVQYVELMGEEDFTPTSTTSGNDPQIKEPDHIVPEGDPAPKSNVGNIAQPQPKTGMNDSDKVNPQSSKV
jgi:hypothetical protein